MTFLCVVFLIFSQAMGDWIIGPVSQGAFRRNILDNFRRGYGSSHNDHADRFDSNVDVQSYDRANTVLEGANSANIGHGFVIGSGGGVAAGSHGANTKQIASKFERGSRINSGKAMGNDNANSYRSGLDTGLVSDHLETDSTTGGLGGSSGRSVKNRLQSRNQQLRDREGFDESMATAMETGERFDRGSLVGREATSATIGHGLGYGVGGGSTGSRRADFAQTRDMGLISSKTDTFAKRNGNMINQIDNKEIVDDESINDAILLGPEGSAGASSKLSRIASKQRALDHRDSGEVQSVKTVDNKLLDSSWRSGSHESDVGINTGIDGPGISYGRSNMRITDGYDRSSQQAVGDSAATKSASSTRGMFNDRGIDQGVRSNVLIGGDL